MAGEERMEKSRYRKRREGGWTPIRVKAQDTRANPNSWETHLVRKRWDIGLLRALSLRIMMMMMRYIYLCVCVLCYRGPGGCPDDPGLRPSVFHLTRKARRFSVGRRTVRFAIFIHS